jgi:hypothetical protein
MQLLAVFIGWLLGMGSNILLKKIERNEKIEDFKNGLQTELLEMLLASSSTTFLLKHHLGGIDHNFLKWFGKVTSVLPEKIPYQQGTESLEQVMDLSPEQLEFLFKKTQPPQNIGKGLKQYFPVYINNNLNLIPLLKEDIRAELFKFLRRIELINQETNRYLFYFDKTFDPASCDVNKDILQDNMLNSIKGIQTISIDTANIIVKILPLLQAKTSDIYWERLRELLNNAKLLIAWFKPEKKDLRR